MSQFFENASNIQQRNRKQHFDENAKIWYTSDGVAVTTLYIPSWTGRVQLTQNEIFDDFSGFGEIQKVQVVNKSTRSYGFVTFRNAQSATNAFGTGFHDMGSYVLRVAIANNRRQKKQFVNELTNGNVTQILDLNDDCLAEIFSRLNVMDLCTVSRTTTRMKEIANRTFSQKYKVCELMTLAKTLQEARRILVTFGTFISQISLESNVHENESAWARLLELVTLCCNDTLKSLFLCGFKINLWLTVKLRTLFNTLMKLHINYCLLDESVNELFADCRSMMELKVSYGNDGFEDFIFKSTFPKLERLQCKSFRGDWGDFLSRHQNLKSLSVHNIQASELPLLAKTCRQLEEFEVTHLHYSNDFEESVHSLLTLHHIKKLRINCLEGNLTKFTQQLKSLDSLKYLELNTDGDDDCISAVGDLNQLTELSIKSLESIEFDVPLLIERLNNLRTLKLHVKIKMDMEMYVRIVEIVRQRPARSQQTLQIACSRTHGLQSDVDNRSIVRLISLKNE